MNIWMHDDEIKAIEGYLKPTDLFFEWGSGGSTIKFGKMVSKYVSVEHDYNWYMKMNNELRNRGLAHKVFLFHVPSNHPRTFPTKYEEFENYINFKYDDKTKFDKILVDGRGRQFCAESALSFIKEDGLLFVHDYFERNRYLSIEDNYDLISSIRHTPQTLAIFRPKEGRARG